MDAKARILVVEDQPREAAALVRLLRTEGYEAATAASAAEALRRVDEPIDLVLCDVRLGSDDGVELLERWKRRRPTTPFVMATAFGEVPSAVNAMKLGAVDYLTKPFDPQELLLLIRRTVDSAEKTPEDKSGHQPPKPRILAQSAIMLDLLDQVRRAAQAQSLVLVLGESGAGKELVAAAIHEQSGRRTGPYVAVNIAAVPENLVEAELFGHVQGAFTGAAQNRAGRFEAAEGGTLFIDEIGDCALPVQAKLLRVLETLTVTPVGGNRERRVDVRVVAATSRSLPEMVEKGEFREDLYYRLNVLTIQLPPLRERREDIPLLIEAFTQELSRKHQRSAPRFASDLMQFMLAHDWPGNVRELRNVIEHLLVMARGDEFTLGDLPAYLAPFCLAHPKHPAQISTQNLQEMERAAVLSALARCSGVRSHAADLLGISVRTLQRKLKAWKIDEPAE